MVGFYFNRQGEKKFGLRKKLVQKLAYFGSELNC